MTSANESNSSSHNSPRVLRNALAEAATNGLVAVCEELEADLEALRNNLEQNLIAQFELEQVQKEIANAFKHYQQEVLDR